MRTLLTRSLSTNVLRNQSFAKVSSEHVRLFESILGNKERVMVRGEGDGEIDDIVESHNTDWMRRWKGDSSVVLFPESTQQVSDILRYCNEKKIAVTPQGGNTGLVGGSIPCFDEIILSLSKMNRILDFDDESGVIKAEAGCILENLDNYVGKKGCIMPLDLGAKGSCQIGGNVSTNAGGLRYIRYGSLKGTVLGMEVVLANGEILNLMDCVLRKNNTGFDIKQLFIGAEGTLGVITKVCIQTPKRPSSTHVALLGCRSFSDVRSTFTLAKENLGEILSAVEFMDKGAFQAGLKMSGGDNVLGSEHDFYVLLETSGSCESHDREKVTNFLDRWMCNTTDSDANGVLAQDETQLKKIWSIRENVGPSCSREGLVYKYDISLPLGKMYDVVNIVRERLLPNTSTTRVVGYGHLGDSNLHLNVVVPDHDENVLRILEPFVFDFTTKHSGSISAEHGVGQCKNVYLNKTKPEAVLKSMHGLKKMFDPNGILNPYKVLLIDN